MSRRFIVSVIVVLSLTIVGLSTALLLDVRERERMGNNHRTALSDLRRSIEEETNRNDQLQSNLERAEAQISALQRTLEDTRILLRQYRKANTSAKGGVIEPEPLEPKSTVETDESDEEPQENEPVTDP